MNTFSKRLAGFVGLGIVTTIAVAAVAYAAVSFGPSRPTFTWAKPATYITFNSITDNPVWGDERFLVKARDVNAGSNTYSTKMSVTDNQELLVTVYFHNNAAANLNLVAKNTKVKVNLPSGTASSQELKAFISADNATPQTVFSTMDLTNANPFTLQFVPGSAQLKTNNVTAALSDNIVKDGVLVGTNGPNGNVPGCGEFSGYATFRVKVNVEKPQPQPEVKFACEALDVNKVSRTRFDFTARASVTNATVQSYVFTAKDANGNVVDTQTVATSALTANYIFNRDVAGTYTISVVVKTDKGDANGAQCVKHITVEAPPVVSGTVTPPTKELPVTGPASVIGLFAGASALAGIGHYVWNRARF